MSDAWSEARKQVVERLDVLREYMNWGFRPISENPVAGKGGWIQGHGIGRDDQHPSAGVCVAGSKRGAYRDHGADLSFSSFFYAAAHFQAGLSDDKAALRHFAEKVGVAIPQVRGEPLTPTPFSDTSKLIFCRSNPGIDPSSLDRIGAFLAKWNNRLHQNVVVFPVYDERDVCGHVLMSSVGKTLSVPQRGREPEERRKHTLAGSKGGWINKFALERLKEDPCKVEVLIKVEGVTDVAAFESFIPEAVRGRHVVITNSGGAGEFPHNELLNLLPAIKGLKVFVVPDADEPGVQGAKKWGVALKNKGLSGGHIKLPYPIEAKHGKDVRDWILEGHTYQDFLALADAAEPFADEEAKQVDLGAVESITVNGRQLYHVTEEAIASLERANSPPTLFTRDGRLTQIINNGTGYRLDFLDEAQVRHRLSRTARWIKSHEVKGDEDVYPPKDIAQNIVASQSLPFPPIDGITVAPIFDSRGKLHLGRGYCSATRLWNDFNCELHVPDKPTPQQVADARELILGELLADFPFHDNASRAGAVEFMLRPFVRQMIDGSTPLTLVHAPTERTGKGLLLEVLTIPFLGTGVALSPTPAEDDELRKDILAKLLSGKPIFVLDNLPERQLIDFPSLASVLTTDAHEGRILGKTKNIVVASRACWAATGNNPRLSSELCGRTVSVRLNATDEDPSQRKGFRHPRIAEWAKEHRWLLVDACLTLIQAWISQGKPEGLQTLGRYEAWASIMGGILDVAGVYGLLENRGDFMAQANETKGDWRSFTKYWWQLRGDAPQTSIELADLANEGGLLWEVLGDGSARSQATRMGLALRRVEDRVFGGLMVVRVNEQQAKHGKLFKLVQVMPSYRQQKLQAGEQESTKDDNHKPNDDDDLYTYS
jgi:hypothetical protein